MDSTGITGLPVDGTRSADRPVERPRTANARPNRTRPLGSRPVRTDATGRPAGRPRTPDPRRDRVRKPDPVPDRARHISRPADRPFTVNPRPDRTPANARRPVDRSRNADYPLDPAAGRAVNRLVETPTAAPNPTPEPRPALAVPVTAAEIYRWLRTREGPRPVVRCFGACGNKLVFRGLQSDNGRREPAIILGCGHLVGSICFSSLVDLGKASGEDAPCPHCLKVSTCAAV